ncbi:MAG: hypothetical protein QXE34_01070 [Candidatus Aenigmatarchaeota archaeon]
MLIIKILGMLSFIYGMLLTFSLYFESDYTKMTKKLIFGPVLIVLGILIMKIW